jgi:hypothetical protein
MTVRTLPVILSIIICRSSTNFSPRRPQDSAGLGLPKACVANDEPQFVKRIVWMASEYGRYGSSRITSLLRAEGWWVTLRDELLAREVFDALLEAKALMERRRRLGRLDDTVRPHRSLRVSAPGPRVAPWPSLRGIR